MQVYNCPSCKCDVTPQGPEYGRSFQCPNCGHQWSWLPHPHFRCPCCGTDDAPRQRDGDWVRFKCAACAYEWSHKYKHVGGVQRKCGICGEPALKSPGADYECANGQSAHVPHFVGRVLCWRHGYTSSGGPVLAEHASPKVPAASGDGASFVETLKMLAQHRPKRRGKRGRARRSKARAQV
jgi:hypothetical protein